MDLERLRSWAQQLKRQVVTLRHAATHPGTPRSARIILALVLAYALSPIDLIPDFIPLLGLLDDLVLLPLGIWLAVRMIPAEVWQDCCRRAGESPPELDNRQQ